MVMNKQKHNDGNQTCQGAVSQTCQGAVSQTCQGAVSMDAELLKIGSSTPF